MVAEIPMYFLTNRNNIKEYKQITLWRTYWFHSQKINSESEKKINLFFFYFDLETMEHSVEDVFFNF